MASGGSSSSSSSRQTSMSNRVTSKLVGGSSRSMSPSVAHGELPKGLAELMGSISPVTPYLSVSGCLPVCTRTLLDDGYTAVVCCMDGFEYEFPADRLDYLHVRIEDSPDTDLRPHLEPVCRLIEKHRLRRQAPDGRGRTLVFCAQGVSRSVSFVLAYLMRHQRMNLADAYALVRQRRRLACPNAGFFRQLIDLERQLFNGRQTVRMLELADGFQVADVVWKHGSEMLKEFRE